ncbi:hypothetical protein BDV59DRAFT_211278 [Aspergillus ambiguus]|uniref:uncharacterized protein n=1 Tax=Aspergillus ambiguus TaxID=176160 RepID=UPI003CCD3F65
MKKSQDVSSRKCKRCSRVFSKVEHLRRHERSHTGERPHRCRFCGRAYARSDVLTRHIRDHHSTLSDGESISQELYRPTPNPPGHLPPSSDSQNLAHPTPQNLDRTMGERCDSILTLQEATDGVGEKGSSIEQPRVLLDNSPTHGNTDVFEEFIASHLDLPTLSASFVSQEDVLDPGVLDGILMTPPSSGDIWRNQLSKNAISNEQFEQVRRFWPTRKRRSNSITQQSICWDDIILHPKENLFSSTCLELRPMLDSTHELDSAWGFRYNCRDRLLQDCLRYYGNETTTEQAITSHGNSPDQHQLGWGDAVLPAADILDLCLDLYFYQFQTLLPFICPSTFDASQTPSTLLFPMCLVGLIILNRGAARVLIDRYLPAAIEHCRSQLSSRHMRQCIAPDLFTVLASACLLLFLAASTADIAFDEQRHEFYEETLTLARDRGLFNSHSYDLSLVRAVSNEDVTWKAWGRVQSAERLIAALILSDAYSAHILGVPPVLSSRKIHTPFLPADDLFSIRHLENWRLALGDHDPWEGMLAEPFDINCPRTGLSTFGTQTILSCMWLHILEASHRLIESSHLPTQPLIFAKNEEIHHIASGICLLYEACHAEFLTGNTNSVVLWHLLCLSITAHLPTIEVAAGRNGSQDAQEATSAITAWARTPTARRACLHAAQVLVVMDRQKRSDGVMLHSEMALFNAGLVMGFYLLMAPEPPESWDSSSGYDLLEEIDWISVGNKGLSTEEAPSSANLCSSPAARFIQSGGPVCFRGAKYRNAYGVARRTFMNFAERLGDIGRWNMEEYRRVLHIISDTLLTVPGEGSGGAI